jgi:ComF family protein
MTLPSLTELKYSITHLFYPRLCEGCAKPLLQSEQLLCISCGLAIPETGYHHLPGNETAMRFAGRIPFINATSYAYFTTDGLLQHLVHGLKYKNKKAIGLYLGRRLGEALATSGWATGIDVIVPVPLHKAKEASRGYNQSLLIAEGIAGALHIPVSSNMLLRIRDTESQTKKTRAERVSNMEDAFIINKKINLRTKHILICDDVLTTGATMEACALALLEATDIQISIASIGIAVS